jgi:hypothetical protein
VVVVVGGSMVVALRGQLLLNRKEQMLGQQPHTVAPSLLSQLVMFALGILRVYWLHRHLP